MSNRRRDPILNNSYNQVDYSPDFSSTIEVAPDVSHLYPDATGENIEYERIKTQINEDLYELFKNSEYYKSFRKTVKKMPKRKEPEVFYYFFNALHKMNKYDCYDIVLTLFEFFNINYDLAWKNLLTTPIKEELLKEMVEIHGEERINFKPIF